MKRSTTRDGDDAAALQAAAAAAPNAHYVLRLYVTGTTARSARAVVNIRKICEEHLHGRYELEVIAMVVIGGTALTGGRGTIVGTVLGILILRVMRNGIVLIGVPGLAYNIFVGAIILGMLILHAVMQRNAQRR